MSAQQSIHVVREYLDRFVSGGDPSAGETLVDEAIVFASPYSPEPVHGRDAFVEMIGALRAAFPDLTIHEHAAIGDGDLVAVRWTATGTHTGEPFLGLAATGRRFEIAGMSFYRVRAGRIVEGWVCDDSLGMLTQLGVLPALAPAGAA